MAQKVTGNKICPMCGGERFAITAYEDGDVWQCIRCKYEGEASAFDVKKGGQDG